MGPGVCTYLGARLCVGVSAWCACVASCVSCKCGSRVPQCRVAGWPYVRLLLPPVVPAVVASRRASAFAAAVGLGVCAWLPMLAVRVHLTHGLSRIDCKIPNNRHCFALHLHHDMLCKDVFPIFCTAHTVFLLPRPSQPAPLKKWWGYGWGFGWAGSAGAGRLWTLAAPLQCRPRPPRPCLSDLMMLNDSRLFFSDEMELFA